MMLIEPGILATLGMIIPIILLIVFAASILLIDVFAESEDKSYLGYLTAFFLFIVLIFVVKDFNSNVTPINLFSKNLVIDRFGLIFTGMFIVAGILTALGSIDYLKKYDLAIGEFYSLILFAIVGMSLMVFSRTLMSVFVSLELMSLPIYALSGLFRANNRSLEASIKYFILGSVASSILLFGMVLLYGATGSVDILVIAQEITKKYTNVTTVLSSDPIIVIGMIMLFIGFMFKTATAPFHMWTPDVYEGAPTIVTGFMSVAVKAAAFATFLRVFGVSFNNNSLLHLQNGAMSNTSWLQILNVFAVATVIIGNIVALNQRNVKRILAYSAIAHAGYLMIGMVAYFLTKDTTAYSALVLYFVSYTFTGMGAFIAISIFEPKDSNKVMLEDLNGAAYKKPFVAALLAVFIFSFAGIPPMSGFFAKFYLFKSAYVDAGLHIPVIIALIASVLSVYYYLRILVHLYMKKSYDDIDENDYKTTTGSILALVIAGVFVFYIGILPDQYITIIKHSFFSLIGG
jgi:NADH-quinone oxidoreductase subunit N